MAGTLALPQLGSPCPPCQLSHVAEKEAKADARVLGCCKGQIPYKIGRSRYSVNTQVIVVIITILTLQLSQPTTGDPERLWMRLPTSREVRVPLCLVFLRPLATTGPHVHVGTPGALRRSSVVPRFPQPPPLALLPFLTLTEKL